MPSKINIELIPVIEIAACDFNENNHVSPSTSMRNAPEEWEIYNQKCYQDAGLDGLQAIEKGEWLFEFEKLSDAHLKIILKELYKKTLVRFESIKEVVNDPIEYAPYISGGFLFIVDDEIKSRPGCCCGLETIREWDIKINDKPTEVWTGHDKEDLIYFDIQDENIQFTVAKETFLISMEDYQPIFKKAEKMIDVFIKRNGPLLNEVFKIKKGAVLAKAMIYK